MYMSFHKSNCFSPAVKVKHELFAINESIEQTIDSSYLISFCCIKFLKRGGDYREN